MDDFSYYQTNDLLHANAWSQQPGQNPWVTSVPVEQHYYSNAGQYVVGETPQGYQPQVVSGSDHKKTKQTKEIQQKSQAVSSSDHHKKKHTKEIQQLNEAVSESDHHKKKHTKEIQQLNEAVSESDHHKKKHTKESEQLNETEYLREERFLGLPISAESLLGVRFGSASPLFIEIKKYLNIEPNDLPSKTPEMIPMFVEKAAQGIIEEGKKIEKEEKVKQMVAALIQNKDKGKEEVWKQCVYLYTSKNFLYNALNETMKLVGDQKQENKWRSKVPTLGPFCLLLLDNPFNKELTKNKTIYRSANIKPEEIVQYEEMAKSKSSHQSFKVYTSCTRNLEKAKALGNTLFTMDVLDGFILDISPYSKYPKEEEELITPGVCFCVKSVKFHQKKKRYLINLELRQKFSSILDKIPKSIVQPTKPKKHIYFAYMENEHDAPLAERLINYFDQRRFRVYFPREKEDLNTKIANGIENAAVVLVFPSLDLQKSKDGSKILNYADQTKVPMLAIKIYKDFQPVDWLGTILALAKYCSNDFDEVIDNLISMKINTSDLILERGEKNEPQPIDEYLFKGDTKSENVKASYHKSGEEFPVDFDFLGLKQGNVFGQGDDKHGAFTLTGEYKLEGTSGVIEMKKQYVGKDSVTYQGKISFEELKCVIEGEWKEDKVEDKFSIHLTLPRPYTGDIEQTPLPEVSRKKGTKVMISYCPSQYDLAQKITNALIAKDIRAVCPRLQIHEMIKTAGRKAAVVVPLMSKAYESSDMAKRVLSYVDEADIPIVPVKAQKPYTQSGWLGVICAGALYTEMTDVKIFDKKLDELIKELKPYLNNSGDEEQDDILVDGSVAEGYYMRSGKQIPLEFEMFSMVNGYISGEGKDDVGPFVIQGTYNGLQDTEDLKYEFSKHYVGKYGIQYSGTITAEDSELIFEGKWSHNNESDRFHLEVPVNESSVKFHVMLSYNWKSQELIKKIAGKLKENDVPIWFDIDGDMKGNINAAMASGVEGAAMIISFDTVAYSKSANCQKEFTYATQLGKSIIPVLLEDEKGFKDTWLGKAIASLKTLNMKKESKFDSCFDSILKIIKKALEKKVREEKIRQEKELNEPPKPEVITRFEGGVVRGKDYKGDKSFAVHFDLFSLREGKVFGEGVDKIAVFIAAGTYDNEGNVNFKKQYVGKHAVEYKGKLKCDEFGGFKIKGKWNYGSATGKFSIKSVSLTIDVENTHYHEDNTNIDNNENFYEDANSGVYGGDNGGDYGHGNGGDYGHGNGGDYGHDDDGECGHGNGGDYGHDDDGECGHGNSGDYGHDDDGECGHDDGGDYGHDDGG
ncbi:unnamed protein product, partial [Rotaria socialis]